MPPWGLGPWREAGGAGRGPARGSAARRARRGLLRVLLLAVLTAGLLLLTASGAGAHPLGNFTVNTATGLRLTPVELVVDQVVDMAEIPTFQARPELDGDGDGQVSGAETGAWAARRCRAHAAAADARLDGRRLSFTAAGDRAVRSRGSGGLDVLRLECRLSAPVAAGPGRVGRLGRGPHTLAWRSTAYADRVGWHEVTAVGDGVTLAASDVPAASPSGRLTRYPAGLLNSPPAVHQATVRFAPGGPRLDATGPAAVPGTGPAGAPGGIDRPARALTRLVAERSETAGGLLLAVVLAAALGALHAASPGHGKTVMAAYLVGLRGTLRDAAVIGGTVTLTHTAGVLALGLLLGTARALAPERLYPWLGVGSGLLLAALGVGVLRRVLRERLSTGPGAAHGHGRHEQERRAEHEHRDAHGRGHRHEHPGADGHPHERVDGHGRPRPRDLVALGFAGGLAPSPSALVVLLAAATLGRAWLGVALVLAYGAGMAATLTVAGLLLVRVRGLPRRWRARGRQPTPLLARLARIAPAGTAGLITLGGLGLAVRSAAALLP
jgi:nickel/cobalt exporter